MGEVLDFRGQADHATDGIVSIINAMAKSKQAETELQKSIMLDQLKRQRDRQDKQNEMADQNSAWSSAMAQDAPQGNPMTNNTGIANSATPDQVGSPEVSPIGGAMPEGLPGMPKPGETAMSSAFPMTGGGVVQPPPPQVQPATVLPSATPMAIQATAPEHPASQIADLGFNPIGVGQLGLSRKGRPEPKDYAYVAALNKAKQGNASEGELDLIKDFNGYKGGKDANTLTKMGIDTVNLSPEMIQQSLKQRNPGHYAFLESIKNGNIDLKGRSSKEMQKVMEEVQTMWPGTNMTMVQSRIKTRNDFTSGKESQNIKALNTAIGHLDALHKIIPDLHNTDSSWWNAPAQAFEQGTGIGLNPAVKRFQFTKNALSGELATVFKSTGGTDTEISNISKNINEADSPKNLEEVTKAAVELLNSRLAASESKWKNTFFQEDDPEFPVLNDKSREIISRLGGESQAGGTGPIGNSGGKTYAGLTIQQAKAQGYTGFDTDKNQWVK